jgi:hypothetical protein
VTFSLLRLENNPLVPPSGNVLQRMLEMLLAVFDDCRVLLIRGQVRMDELNEAIEIFRCDLCRMSALCT